MGAINSYPQYRTYLEFSLGKGTPSTGIVYAIYTIGNLAGLFAQAPQISEVRFTSTSQLGIAHMFIGGLVISPACVSEMAHPLNL